jgi:thiamine biosynthesis lipoprotein ApbE
MNKKYILLCILLLSAIGLFFWQTKNREKQTDALHKSYTTMGTVLEFIVYPQTSGTKVAIAEARKEIERLNRDYSRYREDSIVSRLHLNSPEPVKVSAEFLYLLKRNSKIYHRTGKQFDPTVGPLVEIWGFYRHQGNIPGDTEIDRARRQVGMDKIIQKENKIALPEGIQLDFGASVKGYAVDRAAKMLRDNGENNFLINLGGNIYASGSPPHSGHWSIGLRNPRDKSKINGSVSLKNEAVATSGDYERMFIKNNKRYAHIINPKTGRPVKGVAAVTTIADSALTADLYSTAIFLTGPEEDYLKEAPLFGFLVAETKNEHLKYRLTSGFEQKLLTNSGELTDYNIIKN